ncbi:hypothetical protein M231_04532 [Tremella mesenterica]|uniref:Acyl-protein thioesterase 1 n=1 Tax=Tremella mesenterica TaxID=5217 RepID=A0A4Q1BK68_TREME|nr:hypothetical protein M231_04532 [Tremella mesenterica]
MRGDGMLELADSFYDEHPNLKWILPHAPILPITINRGKNGNARWYDRITLDPELILDPEYHDEEGLHSIVQTIDEIIQAEVDSGIPEKKILVGGISQGGSVALLLGLTTERKLGGLIGLSTWIPFGRNVEMIMTRQAKEIPIFLAHGKEDPLVVYSIAESSLSLLTKSGFQQLDSTITFVRPGILFKGYSPLTHWFGDEEIDDLSEWVGEVLKD